MSHLHYTTKSKKGQHLNYEERHKKAHDYRNSAPERRLGAKKFRETFKTITCDNGRENLDFEGIERSVLTNIPRKRSGRLSPYEASLSLNLSLILW